MYKIRFKSYNTVDNIDSMNKIKLIDKITYQQMRYHKSYLMHPLMLNNIYQLIIDVITKQKLFPKYS